MRYEGNIFRPPGEWRSYLLQVTVGCTHNKCTFCNMYKDKRFHVRPLPDILEDIRMAREYYGSGVEKVFLCDGDAIVMRQEQLLLILKTLYETFPALRQVTVYAGPRSTRTKTAQQLRELREAGLTRAYLGVETGWDALLQKVQKGCSRAEMLEAGTMLREAGIDLWVMVILGLGGSGENSRKHIWETVSLMNEMKPRHFSALTLMVEPGTALYDEVHSGALQLLSPAESLMETKWLVEGLQVDPLHFTSNHASNYLPLKGSLPEDRDKFLSMIDASLRGEGYIKKEAFRAL